MDIVLALETKETNKAKKFASLVQGFAKRERTMQVMLLLLRAAHCRSTHHYFALDALKKLKTPPAQRLGRLLLKYHDQYLDGAQAPDCRFKDFENHVIHVQENNWGGAAQKCREWHQKAVDDLNRGKWRSAAYACGVLSHYFTDPIMPLHTGQSPEETIIHRPIEWSFYKAYDSIYKLVKQQEATAEFQFAAGSDWIGKAVLAVAQLSNSYFGQMAHGYQMDIHIFKPGYGLNEELREMATTLFTLAVDGWAAVLTRMADEVSIDLPSVSLGIPSVLAAVDLPLARLVRKVSDRREQRAVRAVLREFQRTGAVVKKLSDETLVVHRAKQAWMLSSQGSPQSSPAESSAASGLDEVVSLSEPSGPDSSSAIEPADFERNEIGSGQLELPDEKSAPIFLSLAEARARIKGYTYAGSNQMESLGADNSASSSSDEMVSGAISSDPDSNPDRMWSSALPKTNLAFQGAVVHFGSPLIESPSIGPKTAKRFEKIGIRTIGEFVGRSPDELESLLETRWITASIIGDWQDQSRLVCEVPALPSEYSQLLVAIGCRTGWQLRTANPSTLLARLVQFGQTSEGQQILQNLRLPTIGDIAGWIESARNQARQKAA